MVRLVEILTDERQSPVYSTKPMPRVMMVLATPEANASAAMVLTQLPRHIPVSSLDGLQTRKHIAVLVVNNGISNTIVLEIP